MEELGISDCQLGHGALQGVAGPVIIVPAQEPSGEGGRLVFLLDSDDRCPAVSVGRIRLDIAGSWERSGHLLDRRRRTNTCEVRNQSKHPNKKTELDPKIKLDPGSSLTVFTHRTPLPQSSPPRRPHFRSRQTTGKERKRFKSRRAK